mmetsp:Transcript_21795/g.48495  ORF Transcript_21795/g.48495 Transcript_21795/m.48495 type:complete len:234 (+) Transcript_21795:422-1123(+)
MLPHHARGAVRHRPLRAVEPRRRVRLHAQDPLLPQRLRARLLHHADPQRPDLPLHQGLRHQRQPDSGFLLGHGAVPAHPGLRREAVHQLPLRTHVLASGHHLLRLQAVPAPGRVYILLNDGVNRAADSVPVQVLLLGDGVLLLYGHTARPRGLLHLLGLPRVRALDVHRAHVLHDRTTQLPVPARYALLPGPGHLLHLGQLRLRQTKARFQTVQWQEQGVGQAARLYRGEIHD